MFSVYFDKRMLKILLLGAISGFPWVLIGSSLSLWLKEDGLSRSTVGWAGLIFAQPLILRVRIIGEHGAMPELIHKDARQTTRTTLATWWEKLLFGPNNINYHHEHHLAATIPSYNYPKLNKILQQRGYFKGNEQALVRGGYMEVMRLASAKAG